MALTNIYPNNLNLKTENFVPNSIINYSILSNLSFANKTINYNNINKKSSLNARPKISKHCTVKTKSKLKKKNSNRWPSSYELLFQHDVMLNKIPDSLNNLTLPANTSFSDSKQFPTLFNLNDQQLNLVALKQENDSKSQSSINLTSINLNACAICDSSFRTTSDLVQHMRFNHRESKYKRKLNKNL